MATGKVFAERDATKYALTQEEAQDAFDGARTLASRMGPNYHTFWERTKLFFSSDARWEDAKRSNRDVLLAGTDQVIKYGRSVIALADILNESDGLSRALEERRHDQLAQRRLDSAARRTSDRTTFGLGSIETHQYAPRYSVEEILGAAAIVGNAFEGNTTITINGFFMVIPEGATPHQRLHVAQKAQGIFIDQSQQQLEQASGQLATA